MKAITFTIVSIWALFLTVFSSAFAPVSTQRHCTPPFIETTRNAASLYYHPLATSKSVSTALFASSEENGIEITESDQAILGAAGTIAALITFYSEFTLKTTGCGLPAGPFGIVGLLEGLSYLGVTGLAVYSIVTKVRTVRIY